MIMITAAREIRKIERIDRVFILKESWVWRDPIPFDASTVRSVLLMVAEGIPEMIPEDELRDRPGGRDPEMIENEISSPLTEGVIENGWFFDRT